jgi:integrase
VPKSKTIYYRMRAVKRADGAWHADESGDWQYLSVPDGAGKPPDWLKLAKRQAADGGRGFQFRSRTGTWGEPIYRTLEAAREAANADSDGTAPVTESVAAGILGSLAVSIDKFLDEVEANKQPKTYASYQNSLTMFREFCHKTDLGHIERADIIAFKSWLKNRTYADGSKMSPRTWYNNFLNVSVFFKWAGRSFKSMGITKGDWFPKPEREPEAYTPEELTALFSAAEDDERLVLKSLLNTGFRSGELAHLTYGDIDARHSIWRVRAKTLALAGGKREWKPKTTDSEREMPVHDDLTKRIMARKRTLGASDNDLIFPNSEGNPDSHLIRIVKRVAKRAKVTGRVDDHKFRSTAITLWLRAGSSVPDVASWVGHSDLQTILRYAAKLNLRSEETRKKITSTFAEFSSVGD